MEHTRHIDGIGPLSHINPESEWPRDRFSNKTEAILQILANAPATTNEIASTLDDSWGSARRKIQAGVREGTIRPLSVGRRASYRWRLTNKGRWALRFYWGRRSRYDELPLADEDAFGMVSEAPIATPRSQPRSPAGSGGGSEGARLDRLEGLVERLVVALGVER